MTVRQFPLAFVTLFLLIFLWHLEPAYPAEHFTISVLQNPQIDVSELQYISLIVVFYSSRVVKYSVEWCLAY